MLYILIPYRDRADNLAQFLRESLPLFKQHLVNFKIIVIEQGRIVESGTHAELMNDGGKYREMVRLQVADRSEMTEAEA